MAYNISIKNRKGEGVAYSGVNSITLDTPEGDELTIGINNEVEKTVDLDFSNGNMVVTPDGDDVFSKVEIKKPETLTPENIAEGVDIAGIIGTLVAGGGGGDGAQVATGIVTPTSQIVTITHGLGVVPSYIVFLTTFSNNSISGFGNSDILASIATNNNVVAESSRLNLYCTKGSSNTTSNEFDFTGEGTLTKCIHSVNAQTFTAGNETVSCILNRKYYWIAIA